jgi:hypothetical protein
MQLELELGHGITMDLHSLIVAQTEGETTFFLMVYFIALSFLEFCFVTKVPVVHHKM